MSCLSLSLIAEPDVDIDASSLSMAWHTGQAAKLLSTQLTDTCGQSAGEVGDYFSCEPTVAPEHIIQGNLRRFHRLAAGWSDTGLLVRGDVGSYFACNMRDGSVTLEGSASDHCASQLRGGRLRIEGSVGNYLGGPDAGVRSGMSGGEVVVCGNAGIHAGHRLRRGLLVVLGDCDEAPGSEMVAGTLVVAGQCGSLVGVGMRRGTIVCAQSVAEPSALRFTSAQEQQLTFARLLSGHLQAVAPEVASRLSAGRVRRAIGDRTVGGQGELWLA